MALVNSMMVLKNMITVRLDTSATAISHVVVVSSWTTLIAPAGSV